MTEITCMSACVPYSGVTAIVSPSSYTGCSAGLPLTVKVTVVTNPDQTRDYNISIGGTFTISYIIKFRFQADSITFISGQIIKVPPEVIFTFPLANSPSDTIVYGLQTNATCGGFVAATPKAAITKVVFQGKNSFIDNQPNDTYEIDMLKCCSNNNLNVQVTFTRRASLKFSTMLQL